MQQIKMRVLMIYISLRDTEKKGVECVNETIESPQWCIRIIIIKKEKKKKDMYNEIGINICIMKYSLMDNSKFLSFLPSCICCS